MRSSAEDVRSARDDLAGAEQELADAQAELALVQTGTTAAPATTTTTPPVPDATVDQVEAAEADLQAAFEGVTDETPLSTATEQVNAAAFALQVAWLRVLADAGCLADDQAQEAVTAVATYTTELETSLATAGYYDGPIDGVYGPGVVAAVEQLQADNDLPVTGYVDRATAAALDDAVLAVGGEAAADDLAHTAALQGVLAVAGYWTGPIDGQWSDELTTALMAFQTDLGVPTTGVVDAATLAALQEAIAAGSADEQAPTTTTTPTTITAP